MIYIFLISKDNLKIFLKINVYILDTFTGNIRWYVAIERAFLILYAFFRYFCLSLSIYTSFINWNKALLKKNIFIFNFVIPSSLSLLLIKRYMQFINNTPALIRTNKYCMPVLIYLQFCILMQHLLKVYAYLRGNFFEKYEIFIGPMSFYLKQGIKIGIKISF